MVSNEYELLVVTISTFILISSPTAIKNTFESMKNIVKYYID